MGEKQCPECAESIQEKAKVCHYCGFRYEEPEPEEDPVQRVYRMRQREAAEASADWAAFQRGQLEKAAEYQQERSERLS